LMLSSEYKQSYDKLPASLVNIQLIKEYKLN
jgi:hypothetical protein